MAKRNIDLTSNEWLDIVFADKNKEFGAYEHRKKSGWIHVLAIIVTLSVIGALFGGYAIWNSYQKKLAEEEAIRARELAAQMSTDALAEAEEEPMEEEEEVKYEQEEVVVPEETLATVQVTQIAIVDAGKVENEIMNAVEQEQDNTARGQVTQTGGDDVDKLHEVKQQVVVEEPKPQPKEEQIFTAVEQQAMFPGGEAALMKWLSSNIHYPETAAANDIQGRVVVKFVVEKDGSISNVTIARGVDKDLDKEAVRVVKKMPKWNPAKNNGQAVRCYFNLPVKFQLAER